MSIHLHAISSAILSLALSMHTSAQRLEPLTKGPDASLRGLSVVSDGVVWVSGSKGTVGRSTDAGRTWTWSTVQGFEKTDFRDIEAFDESTAVIMGVAEPGVLLRTDDGGRHWRTVYRDGSKGVFLDAMDFLPDGRGVVVGDPIDGRVYLAASPDSGRSWKKVPANASPASADGEAFFAASGTNLRLLPDGGWMTVTGGTRSRFLMNDLATPLPLTQGRQTTGANSVAYRAKGRRILAVGGDFSSDTLRDGNAGISKDAGRTWATPMKGPYGYRSGVEWIRGRMWITCGTSGVDVTKDDGRTWENLTRTGYHVCRRAKNGRVVYLAGSGGRMAVLVFEK